MVNDLTAVGYEEQIISSIMRRKLMRNMFTCIEMSVSKMQASSSCGIPAYTIEYHNVELV
jgi:hypothetical protein